MELGFQLVEGWLLGIRHFRPTDEMPYNEVQLFIGFICFYVIWD